MNDKPEIASSVGSGACLGRFHVFEKSINRLQNNFLLWLALVGHVWLIQTAQASSKPIKSLISCEIVGQHHNLSVESRQLRLVFLENARPKSARVLVQGNLRTPFLQERNEFALTFLFAGNAGMIPSIAVTPPLAPDREQSGKQSPEENLGYGIKRLIHDLLLVISGMALYWLARMTCPPVSI